MTKDENDLLTQVEGNAPMGVMLKQRFWVPATTSDQVGAGDAPLRVRLFGENFIAWRDHDGRAAFFNEHCPHRGASLALARNENNALRCLYHGWQFGSDGTTRDVPTQVGPAKDFCKKVPLKHYPVREAGGVIWVWLGSGGPAPRFPDFKFTKLPAAQRRPHYQKVHANWLQGVETTMDSSHATILHQSYLAAYGVAKELAEDSAPRFEVDTKPYGFRYAAIRKTNEGKHYVRTSEFVLPWYGIIAPPFKGLFMFFSVPIDNEHTAYWTVPYREDAELEENTYTVFNDSANWPPRPLGGPDERWGQDRALMAQGHFTGFPQHLTTEDFAIIESQGPIWDRTKEFLNSADAAIVRVRRLLLEAVRKFTTEGVTGFADQSFEYDTIAPLARVMETSSAQNWPEAAAPVS